MVPEGPPLSSRIPPASRCKALQYGGPRAPDVDPALRTGIAAEVAVLRNLLQGSAEELRNPWLAD
jgi:hypothetical protein